MLREMSKKCTKQFLHFHNATWNIKAQNIKEMHQTVYHALYNAVDNVTWNIKVQNIKIMYKNAPNSFCMPHIIVKVIKLVHTMLESSWSTNYLSLSAYCYPLSLLRYTLNTKFIHWFYKASKCLNQIYLQLYLLASTSAFWIYQFIF
jgi:hypothetical protein